MHVFRHLPKILTICLAEQIISPCSKPRPLTSSLLLTLLTGMYPAIAEDRRVYMLQNAKYYLPNHQPLYGRFRVYGLWGL